MPDRSHVLLLRSPDTPDRYVAAFATAGFAARSVPVLRFECVGRGVASEVIAQANTFSGLICTSPRAIEAVRGLDLSGWQEKPAFAVGPTTAEAMRALGLHPEGEEAGEAETLAAVIAAHRFDRPLLFLCGDRRRDALPDALRAARIAFEERVVYRTQPDASAWHESSDRLPDWVVFFSPSGVEAVQAVAGFPWNRVRKAAIGPTTADALRAAGFAPAAVAATPTPEALAAAVSLACHAPDA